MDRRRAIEGDRRDVDATVLDNKPPAPRKSKRQSGQKESWRECYRKTLTTQRHLPISWMDIKVLSFLLRMGSRFIGCQERNVRRWEPCDSQIGVVGKTGASSMKKGIGREERDRRSRQQLGRRS